MHSRPFISLFALVLAALLGAALLLPTPAHAAGLTCLTAASGAWTDPATWSACNGGAPGSTDDVYIQSGHVVTLTADVAVHNVNISTGTTGAYAGADATLALGSNVLDISGSLRLYYAALGVTPGKSVGNVHTNAITITPGSQGRIRFVGDTRAIINTGEWSATNAGSASTYAVEIAMNQGMTATIGAQTKASSWRVHSGVLTTEPLATLFADNGGPGDFTIDQDGVFLSPTSSPTVPIIARTQVATPAAGKLTVAGRLIFTGTMPLINVSSADLSGSVEYRGNAQTLVKPILNSAGAIPLTTYGNLVLAGGVKSLAADTTVNGILTLESGSLDLSGHALTYGPDGGVRYAGATAQTPGAELPTSLPRLDIVNPNGLDLPADLAVTRAITLASDLRTAGHVLTLGPDAACAGTGDVLGSVTRTSLAAATAYCFGHPHLRVTFHADATMPSAVTATTSRTAPTLEGAVSRHYTIEAPGFSGEATLRLPFRDDELGDNIADKLHLWHMSGADWVAVPPSATDPHYVEADHVTAFSLWALKNGPAPTAVTLVDLTASQHGGPVSLHWQTGSELETVAFRIYRSTEPNLPATPLAVIPAQAPGSPGGADYTWTDSAAPQPGVTYYYWVAAVDWQGRAAVNPPLAVRLPSLYLPWVSGGER